MVVACSSSATHVAEASSLVRRSSQSKASTKPDRSVFLRVTKDGSKEDKNKDDAILTSETKTKTKAPRAAVSQAKSKSTTETIDSPEGGVYVDKPVLRGKFHKWGAILYPPLFGIPLHLLAIRSSAAAATAATAAAAPPHNLVRASLLFSFAVESIMVVSATLHRFPWKTYRGHGIARKLDFTAIFFGIASLYSSMGRLLMGHHHLWKSVIEPLVWTCAIVGSLLKWKFPNAPPWANASVFLVQGWATLPCIPILVRSASPSEASGLVGGGLFVTLGALAYSLQWPKNIHNKAQREIVFGPHEVFHVGTLLMVLSFWYTMWVNISSSSASSASMGV